MPNLTNGNITQLINRFLPLIFFDPSEQFFPSTAEEFLAHQSLESWNNANSHLRGTAVLKTQSSAVSYSSADVQAGTDAPNGKPLTFDFSVPTGIGQNFAFDPTSEDLFLDCAGWNDAAGTGQPGGQAFTSGSIEYLQTMFSGLANAMNPSIPVTALAPPPKFSIARSTLPTIYAELDWAGRYPILDQQRIKQEGGAPDFPPTMNGNQTPTIFSSLNKYLALTYYFFYPAMQTSPNSAPDPSIDRNREGQWEAITIFLAGNPDFGTLDPRGLPDFPFDITNDFKTFVGGIRDLTPKFLVYSQGYGLGDDNFAPLAAEVRPWPNPQSTSVFPVTISDWTHPLVFVTAGTHRNLFSVDAIVTPGKSSGPDTTQNTEGGALMGAAGLVAGICAALIAFPIAAIICALIALACFIAGLILLEESYTLEPAPQPTEGPVSTQQGTDIARDDGPAIIPDPQAITVPINATSSQAATLRMISQFDFDKTPIVTTFPPPPGAIEFPSWWDFPGRWGVRVAPVFSGQWDSGTRRTAPFGRSRAYWNAYQLVQFVAASGGTESF